MASIKNFGISGVSSDVQFGKGNGRVVYNANQEAGDTGDTGRFRITADGSSLMKLQVAEPFANTDAATKFYVDDAISAISGAGSIADIESDIAAITASVGLTTDANGRVETYNAATVFSGDTYLSGTDTDILTALGTLDSAAAGIDTNVSNIETSMGSMIDANGNFVTTDLLNSNSMTSATNVTEALLALDSDLQAYQNAVSTSAGSIIDATGAWSAAGLAGTSMDGAVSLEAALVALDTAIEGKDTLAELLDTEITAVADNQVLTWDATANANAGAWVNSDDLFLNGELVVTGNVSALANLVLNADATGAATDDAIIMVERGDDPNVDIRYNETDNQWEFTNDGTTYYPFLSTADVFGGLSVTNSEGSLSSLAFNSTTGVFTYDGVTDAEVRNLLSATNVTADAGGSIGSLTYNATTGVFNLDLSATDIGGAMVGGVGVTLTDDSPNDGVFEINIGQDVSTTSDVTFANVSVNGTLFTDDVTAATVTASGDVVVQGNLTVSGTTTTVNTETINLADNIITLNSNEAGTPSQNGGIEIERGTETNVALRWNETSDKWEVTTDGTNYFEIGTDADKDVYVERAALTNAGGSIGTIANVSGRTYYASKVTVTVTTAFDGTGLTVTGGGQTLATSSDIDEATVGTYVIEQDYQTAMTAGGAIALATGSATAGAAIVTVEYVAV